MILNGFTKLKAGHGNRKLWRRGDGADPAKRHEKETAKGIRRQLREDRLTDHRAPKAPFSGEATPGQVKSRGSALSVIAAPWSDFSALKRGADKWPLRGRSHPPAQPSVLTAIPFAQERPRPSVGEAKRLFFSPADSAFTRTGNRAFKAPIVPLEMPFPFSVSAPRKKKQAPRHAVPARPQWRRQNGLISFRKERRLSWRRRKCPAQ